MQKQMKSLFLACVCTCSLTLPIIAQKTDLVNPIIGTNGMGHTFPGACVPFGIVQVSPDTDTIPHNINGVYQPRAYEYCAGYQYKDSSIVGFSHTHFSGTELIRERLTILTAVTVHVSATIRRFPVPVTTKSC